LTTVVAKLNQIGIVALVTAMMTAGLCSDALARHHKKRPHVRGHSLESRERVAGKRPWLVEQQRFVEQQPVRLGPMRYYGGPKSPAGAGRELAS
jgi:hypothetical protein